MEPSRYGTSRGSGIPLDLGLEILVVFDTLYYVPYGESFSLCAHLDLEISIQCDISFCYLVYHVADQ